MTEGGVKSSLRILLRHLNRLPSASKDQPLRLCFTNNFRLRARETDKVLVNQFRNELHYYARTISAVAEQKVNASTAIILLLGCSI